MNVLGEIIEKMLTYAIIIALTRLVLRKTYLSDSFINENTQNVIEIDKKLYAKIFFVIAIIWSILLIIIGSLPSNVSGSEKHLIAGIVIGLNCCGYVLAFYYYFDIVRIDKDGIYVRRGFLRKKRYHFDEIKSYQINQSNRLVINLVNGKNFKLLSSEDDKILQQDVIEKLKAFHIPLEKSEKDEIVVKRLKAEMGLSIFLASGCFVLLLFTIHIIWFCFLLICAMIFEIEEALTILIDRIVIRKDTIQVVKLFKRTKYIRDFDMKNKKIKKVENGYWVYVYGEKKLLFKYSSAYTNVKQIDHRLRNIPIKKDEAAK